MISSPNRTPAEDALIAQFGALDVAESGTITELRRDAFEQFEVGGLPHRRVEAYKYTDLKRALTDVPPIAGPVDDRPAPAETMPDAVAIHIRNGRVDVPDTLPDGVTIMSLRDVLSSDDTTLLGHGDGSSVRLAANDALVQLNTAFMGDGAVIRVAAETDVEKPIDLIHRLAGPVSGATCVRHIVSVEPGAQVKLLESHLAGTAGHLSNVVIELRIGEGARVSLIRRQEGDAGDRSFSTALVDLTTNANLQYFNLNTGATLSRGQIFLSYQGEGAHADLLGATIAGDTQLLDTTLFVDHATPNCTSTEVFKTVIRDRARSVFQGKIIVRQHAQKTDARMMSCALLLSDEAEAINKPELEIYADDVQCAHGATTGAIDDDMLFYLLSRGLPRAEAEHLLVQAFLAEPIEAIEDESIRTFILDRMASLLNVNER